jgi:5-bromo-4-chloroindolyl phosphate hydrolysis protein
MNIINDDPDAMTEAEKIEFLWEKIDNMNSTIESYKVLLKKSEDKNTRKDGIISTYVEQIADLQEEVNKLSLEVNNARVQASEAVANYIKETSENGS